jgi:hypothetical protein
MADEPDKDEVGLVPARCRQMAVRSGKVQVIAAVRLET